MRWGWYVAAILTMVADVTLDTALPDVNLLPFIVVPVLAIATFAGPVRTLAAGVLAVVLSVFAGFLTDDYFTSWTYWVRLVATALSVVFAVVVARLLANYERRLTSLAGTDPLTGLANRRTLNERLDSQLRIRSRDASSVVLSIDLDGFKAVNTAYGHEAGDLVLQEVAKRFCACTRPEDLVARVGGDEFIVLCPSIEYPSDVDDLCLRLIRSLDEPLVPDVKVEVGATVGAVVVPPGTRIDGEGVLHQADLLMMGQKEPAPGGYVIESAVAPEQLREPQ